MSIQNIYNEWGEDNFTIISNELIGNPNLSAKAKGVLIYLLSKPADWEVYAQEIEGHFKEKIDAIYTALSELEKQGYIIREQTREEGRFSKNEWKVYSSPEYQKSLDTNTSTVTDFTVNGNTVNVKSQTTNTDSTKTNNTKYISYKKEYNSLLTEFNTIVNASYKGSEKVYKQFEARLKEGYTLEEILKATKSASNDTYLMGENDSHKRYLTPEYILRANKLDQWLNANPVNEVKRPKL